MLDHRIETFIVLCDTLNYTGTAKKMCMTQPAVTQHIKYLEQYYDCKLFHYEGKQLFLTDKGKELRELALAMKSNVQKIHDQISSKEQKGKRIRLGATKSIADYIIPQAITNYMLSNRTRDVDLSTENTENLMKKLKEGSIDIAVVEGTFHKLEFECEVLREEPFLCVASPELQFFGTVSLEELFCHRLIVREKGSGTRSILENYLTEHCYDTTCFQTQIEVDNPISIKAMVKAGLGITFLYRCVVEEELQEGSLVNVSIQGMPIRRPLYFVYSKESLFQEECKEFIGEFRNAQKQSQLQVFKFTCWSSLNKIPSSSKSAF